MDATCLHLFFSNFFFVFVFPQHQGTDKKRKQVALQKKLSSCIPIVNMRDFITRNPAETKSRGRCRRMNSKKEREREKRLLEH